MELVHIASSTLPYVSISITVQVGSATDPVGKEGLAYLAGNMLARGTESYDRDSLAQEFDFIGSSLSISVGSETIRISADAATRNLPRLAELLTELLSCPTFPADELEKLKRQTVAEISELRDADSRLAGLFFSQLLFEGHPYGTPTRGYESSLVEVGQNDVLSFYRQYFTRANVVAGVAGDVEEEQARGIVSAIASRLPAGVGRAPTAAPLAKVGGPRVLLVTKPERTQAQVLLGQLGITGADARLFPLKTTITGFGGTFTSPLVREIREKRGWSYGVEASLSPGRYAGLVHLRFAPKTADVEAAASLAIDMLEKLAHDGLSQDDLDFAKQFMANQFPFSVDTPVKRREMELNVLLTGKPADYLERYVESVQAVEMQHARDAVRSLLSRSALAVVVLGDESLEEPLTRLAAPGAFRCVSHLHDGPLPYQSAGK